MCPFSTVIRTVVSILAPAQGASVPEQDAYTVDHVSILAPAQGASKYKRRLERQLYVSILAPAQGAS